MYLSVLQIRDVCCCTYKQCSQHWQQAFCSWSDSRRNSEDKYILTMLLLGHFKYGDIYLT